MTNYASTNEPENHEPMTMLDPQGMEASVSDYMQSAEFKRKLASKQEDKVSNEVQVGDKVTVIHRTSKHHLKSGLIVRFTGREDKNAVVKSTQGLGTFTVAVDFLVKQKNAKPVASAPASVEVARLEELAPELQRELLALEANPTRGIMSDCVAPFLFLGLIEMDCGSTKLTEPGAALVRDYQRRQAEHQPAGDEFSEGDTDNAFDDIRHLQAENARLQSELEAAREALKEIAYSKHCDYSVNGETSYDIGVTDGHRFCAVIAKKALQQVSK